MVLDMCDVRATGLKSFSSLWCGFCGMGMRQDIFHRVGTFPSWRLRLKRCCRGSPSSTAHALRSLGQNPSGPATVLRRGFLSSPVTFFIFFFFLFYGSWQATYGVHYRHLLNWSVD